jgi:uncharacterized protein (DUF2147 family)
MKKTIISTLAILFIVLLAGSPENYAKKQNSIVGQWINQKNDTLKFTLDKKVFLNGREVGTYTYKDNTNEIIVVDLNSSSKSLNREYYKLDRDKQNRLILTNMDPEKQSKEITFNKIYPRVE